MNFIGEHIEISIMQFAMLWNAIFMWHAVNMHQTYHRFKWCTVHGCCFR